MDALTYRELYGEASSVIDTAQAFIAQQQSVIQQGQKTIQAKDDRIAEENKKIGMLIKKVDKLETANTAWKMTALFAVVVATLELLNR